MTEGVSHGFLADETLYLPIRIRPQNYLHELTEIRLRLGKVPGVVFRRLDTGTILRPMD